jgi:serine protease AprX
MPKSVVERNRSQGTQTLDYGPSANQNIQLGIDSMHAWGFHGEGKLIAVMDGGFQNVNQHTAFQHLFANQRITGTRDIVAADGDVYQDHWHGAAVLGNIAAYAPGQVIGGAYNANYFLIRSEDVDSENEIECAYWVVGLELADSVGADLVNSSLGYTTFDVSSLSYTYNSLNGITSIASRSAKLAGGKGMLVLTSAGNEGNNSSWGGWISVPADAENILSVGSVSGAGTYSSFSGRGPTADGRTKPDIVAQGESVVFPNVFASSGITTNSGTSFSCPLICGMAAGIWQAHPEKSALEILNLLKNSGSNRDNPNNQIGWGIPTFVKAHILAGARPVLSFPFDVRVFPNPARERVLTLDLLESNSVGPAVCAVFDARGSKVFESDLTFDLVHQKQNVVLPGLPAGLYQLQIEMGGKSFQRKIILH